MKIRKSIAGIAAAGLAIAGVAVASAPAANAFGPSTAGLYCDVAGISTAVANWNTTWSVNLNGSPGAASVNAGSTVSVDMTYAAGPNNGGPASKGRTQATFEVLNGATVLNTFTSAWSPDASVPGGGVFPGATLTGSFTAPTAGTYSVRVKNVLFEGYLGAGANPLPAGVLGAAVSCNGNAGPYTPSYAANNPTNNQVPFGSTALTALGPNFTYTVSGQTVAGYGRAGQIITVTDVGALFAGTISSVTVGGAAATNTLTISGGAIAGTITIPAGAGNGLQNIVVTTTAETVSKSITILADPAASPLSLAPPAGGLGTTIAVSGSSFNPNGAATLYACANTPAPCIPAGPSANTLFSGSGSVNASGAFTGSITVPSTQPAGGFPTSIKIQAGQGAGASAIVQLGTFSFVDGACDVVDDGNPATVDSCSTVQTIKAEIKAGKLSQAATQTGANPSKTAVQLKFNEDINGNGTLDAGEDINGNGTLDAALDYTQTATSSRNLTGVLNKITVTDTRGVTTQWSLTAKVSDFVSTTDITKTMPATAFSINGLTCAQSTGITGSAPVAPSSTAATAAGQAFTGANVSNDITLCQSTGATSSGGTTGGQWDVNGNVKLVVPAFQAVSQYTATMTVTLA
jgi:hypothetical protein